MADARAAVHNSAQTDAQWWEMNGPLLERVFNPDAYPTAARIGPVAGEAMGAAYDPCRAYRFGLDRVLDGLGVLIERRGRAVTDAAAGEGHGDVRSDL